MTGNGLLEELPVSLDVKISWPCLGIHFDGEVPILFDLKSAGIVNFECVAWQQFADAVKHRLEPRDVAECEIFGERASVELRDHPGIGKNRFNLRAKEECVSVPAVIERLNTQAIASSEQTAFAPIPHHESKHAA